MVEREKQLLKIDSDQHGYAEVCLHTLHTLHTYLQSCTHRKGEREGGEGNSFTQFLCPLNKERMVGFQCLAALEGIYPAPECIPL